MGVNKFNLSGVIENFIGLFFSFYLLNIFLSLFKTRQRGDTCVIFLKRFTVPEINRCIEAFFFDIPGSNV